MGVSTDGLLWLGLCDAGDEGLPQSVVDKLVAGGADEDDLAEAAHQALKDTGVELVTHCSYDYPMYGLAVVSTTAWRGSPSAVDTAPPTDAQIAALKAACEAIGWPYSEPQWWLASLWG